MDIGGNRSDSPGYHLFMLVLCLYALGALAAETAIRFSPGTKVILDYADNAVCAIFLVDFVVSLIRARDRWRYFRTWGWLDLLSSMPMIDIARAGRLARILRVFRVLRGLRATKLVAAMVIHRRAENALLTASLVALLLVIFCSVAVLHFETQQTDPKPNINTPDDAVWWAFATIATVGYGDLYPVTGEGRFVATILMAAGVGLFGTFSGFLAAWFLGSDGDESNDKELRALRHEVAALRVAVQTLVDQGRGDKPLQPTTDAVGPDSSVGQALPNLTGKGW